jgi:hypothetical protein
MSFGLNLYGVDGALTASTTLAAKGMMYGGSSLVSSTSQVNSFNTIDPFYSSTRTGLLAAQSFAVGGTNEDWRLKITTGGRVDVGGVFRPPEAYRTSTGSRNSPIYGTITGWWFNTSYPAEIITMISQPVLCSTMGTAPSISSSPYGLFCTDPSGTSLLLSDSYKAMSHITGIQEAMSVAVPNQLQFLGTPNTGPQDIVSNVTQNVTFPYPLDKPPLIFITSSTGPVSLAHLITDGNGKYVGASVVSPRTRNTYVSSGTTCTGWIDFTAHTFSYFLAYETLPENTNTGYGIQIYDSSSSVVMSSNKTFGEFNTTPVNTPYTQVHNLGGDNANYSWNHVNGSSVNWDNLYGTSIRRAFCLNDFRAIEGISRIVTGASINLGNDFYAVPCSMCYHGNYITVDVASSTVTVSSRGTCTLGVGYFKSIYGIGIYYSPSHEFYNLETFDKTFLISTTY